LADPVAPARICGMIGIVDPASREDVRAGHEGDGVMSSQHEDLRPAAAVAEHDHRGGRSDRHVGCHAKTIARRPILYGASGSPAKAGHDELMTEPGLDLNRQIASLLRDFAAVQKSTQSKWGYQRAAAAVLNLEQPIESFLRPDGTLRKIPNIGPSSTRVILEILTTGTSPTIERAIAESGQGTDIEKRRDLRAHFLSRSPVLAAFRDARLVGPRLEDYRGDLQMHSTWSDGSQTLEEIIVAGIHRGYSYCGVTDHSYGLPIAGGVSMQELAEQHGAIDALNRK